MMDQWNEDDQRLLDRLVADDLTVDEYRAMLERISECERGWQQCALTFLEDQALRKALNSNSTAWRGNTEKPPFASTAVPQRRDLEPRRPKARRANRAVARLRNRMAAGRWPAALTMAVGLAVVCVGTVWLKQMWDRSAVAPPAEFQTVSGPASSHANGRFSATDFGYDEESPTPIGPSCNSACRSISQREFLERLKRYGVSDSAGRQPAVHGLGNEQHEIEASVYIRPLPKWRFQ